MLMIMLLLALGICVARVIEAVFRVLERKYLDEMEDKP